MNEEESINSKDSIEGMTEVTEGNSSASNEDNNNDKADNQIDSTFTLDNLIPTYLISVNNLDTRLNGDINATEWKGLKDKELKVNMCLVKEQTQSLFTRIFQIMTIEL